MATRQHADTARVLLLSGLLVGALRLLAWAAPPLPAARTPADLASWLTVTPADVVLTTLAGVVGWLCVWWLAGSALMVALGRLPGLVGAICSAVGARITPRLLRRAVEGVLGTALVSGSLATALPAGATATPPPASTAAMGVRAWEAAGDPAIRPPGPAGDGWPDLDRPREGPLPPAFAPRGRLEATPPSSGSVTVKRGDTLWGIAARALGDATPAAVAGAWPQWFAANRPVIGRNPDVLHPGQVLRAPGPRRER